MKIKALKRHEKHTYERAYKTEMSTENTKQLNESH